LFSFVCASTVEDHFVKLVSQARSLVAQALGAMKSTRSRRVRKKGVCFDIENSEEANDLLEFALPALEEVSSEEQERKMQSLCGEDGPGAVLHMKTDLENVFRKARETFNASTCLKGDVEGKASQLQINYSRCLSMANRGFRGIQAKDVDVILETLLTLQNPNTMSALDCPPEICFKEVSHLMLSVLDWTNMQQKVRELTQTQSDVHKAFEISIEPTDEDEDAGGQHGHQPLQKCSLGDIILSLKALQALDTGHSADADVTFGEVATDLLAQVEETCFKEVRNKNRDGAQAYRDATTVAKDEATTKQMMKRYRRCQEWLKAFKNHLVDSNLLKTRPEVEELLLETKKEITNRGGYCSTLRRS
jgi:hypothetical protein